MKKKPTNKLVETTINTSIVIILVLLVILLTTWTIDTSYKHYKKIICRYQGDVWEPFDGRCNHILTDDEVLKANLKRIEAEKIIEDVYYKALEAKSDI